MNEFWRNETLNRIDRLIAAFEAHGYQVVADPIEGSEEVFLESLKDALDKTQKTLFATSKRYGYRGLSKKALNALHEVLPNPGFGIEVLK